MNHKFLPAYLLTFVNTLGASILMPVLPFIVHQYSAPKWVFGLLLSLYFFFQFIGAPLLGSMSDQMGRKPVLLISHVGTLLSWVIFIVAFYSPNLSVIGFALPLFIIALARILDGITGGNTSVANAYISDITTKEEKNHIFGYLGGISGIAMVIGPGLGGLSASGKLGHTGTALLAIAISVITLVAIIKGLKESLPESKRIQKPKEHFLQTLNIPKKVREVNPSKTIKRLFTMKLLFTAMLGSYIGCIALYLIDVFKFNEKELGTFMLVVGLFMAFNQAFVSKRFTKKIGVFKTLLLGLALCSFGLFSITFTTNMFLFIGLYYFMNLGLSLSFPTFNALIAIHANEEKKGAVMGISESISSIGMATFPFISAFMYSLIGTHWFHLTSLLPFLGLAIGWYSIHQMGKKAF